MMLIISQINNNHRNITEHNIENTWLDVFREIRVEEGQKRGREMIILWQGDLRRAMKYPRLPTELRHREKNHRNDNDGNWNDDDICDGAMS